MKYYKDKSYPEIKVVRENPTLAKLLTHVYASSDGELTAIHLYAYQSMILKEKYQEISRILMEISEVEMRHLYLLGETICKLGVNPVYADCNFNMEVYWQADYVIYNDDIKTILEVDIESEKQAIHDYQMILTVVDDIYVKDLIERIIEDEEVHLEIFRNILKTFID